MSHHLDPHLLSSGRWCILVHSVTLLRIGGKVRLSARLECNLVHKNFALTANIPEEKNESPYQPLDVFDFNVKYPNQTTLSTYNGVAYQINHPDRKVEFYISKIDAETRGGGLPHAVENAPCFIHFSLFRTADAY